MPSIETIDSIIVKSCANIPKTQHDAQKLRTILKESFR